MTVHVDVNLGDAVWPDPGTVNIPRLLGGHIAVRGYPLSTVLAEKIITAVERGSANTRWRDFLDIYLLSGGHEVDADELSRSVTEVASHRSVRLKPLRDVLDGYGGMAQSRWAGWLRKQQLIAAERYCRVNGFRHR